MAASSSPAPSQTTPGACPYTPCSPLSSSAVSLPHRRPSPRRPATPTPPASPSTGPSLAVQLLRLHLSVDRRLPCRPATPAPSLHRPTPPWPSRSASLAGQLPRLPPRSYKIRKL